MTYVLVQYGTPADAAAFDRYYRETHIPLAKRLPGLRGYTISAGTVDSVPGSPVPAPYLVALLSFDSVAAFEAALTSAEGQATAADLANFATGGVSMAAFEAKNV